MAAGLKKAAAAAKATRVSQKKRLLAASYIGHWVGRMSKGQPTTDLHLVESGVNDEIVAKCGKHMKASTLKEGTGMALAQYFPDTASRCSVCNEKSAPSDVFGRDDETPFPQPHTSAGA